MSINRELTAEEKQLLEEAEHITDEANAKWASGSYSETEEPYKRALEIWEKVCGLESPEVADGLFNLANLYYMQKNFGEAISLYQKSLNICQIVFGAESDKAVERLKWIEKTFFQAGSYDEAIDYSNKALSLLECIHGLGSVEISDQLMSLGHLYYFIGEYTEAEPLYIRALDIREKLFGPEHQSIADCTQRLAILYKNSDELNKDPEPYFRRTLAIYEKELGPINSVVAEAAYRLADFLSDESRYEEAELYYGQMISVLEQLTDMPESEIWWMRDGYVDFLEKTGRKSEAEELMSHWGEFNVYENMLQGELENHIATLGPGHPEVAESLYTMANYCLFEGRLEEAEGYYNQALEVNEKVFGPDSQKVAKSLTGLAKALRAQKKLSKAEIHLARAVAIYEKVPDSSKEDYAWAIEQLARLRAAQGQWEEAKLLYRQSIDILKNSIGEDRSTAETMFNFAALLVNGGELQEAAEVSEELHIMVKNNPDIDVAELEKADYMELHASILDDLGRKEESEALYQQAKEILEKAREEDDDC